MSEEACHMPVDAFAFYLMQYRVVMTCGQLGVEHDN